MNNAQNNTAINNSLTLQQVADAFGQKVWNDSRVYLNQYKGGKNSKTTVYVYINDEGNADVSVYVEARTAGARNYAIARKAEVIAMVREELADLAEELASEAAAEVAEVVETPAKLQGNAVDAERAAAFKSWTPAQRAIIEEMTANGGVALMTSAQMTEFDGIDRADNGHVYEVTIKFTSRGRTKRSVQLVPLQRADDGDNDGNTTNDTPATRLTVARVYREWQRSYYGADHIDTTPIKSIPTIEECDEMLEIIDTH